MAGLGSQGIQLKLGKLEVFFCKVVPTVGGCLYNSAYEAIQKLLVPSSEKVPKDDINPSQNFYPLNTNFDPEKCDNCNGLILWVCTELFYFRYSLKFAFLSLFFFF